MVARTRSSKTSTRSAGRGAKKGTVIKVDFTGVESSGNVEEGRQLLTVKEVELKEAAGTGNEYLKWVFKVYIMIRKKNDLKHCAWVPTSSHIASQTHSDDCP